MGDAGNGDGDDAVGDGGARDGVADVERVLCSTASSRRSNCLARSSESAAGCRRIHQERPNAKHAAAADTIAAHIA